MRMFQFISNQIQENKNIFHKIRLLVSELGRSKLYSLNQIKTELKGHLNALFILSLQLCDIKQDFEIINWIKSHLHKKKSSTIYIVLDAVNHEILETFLLYFDNIEFEKYYA